MYRGHYLMAHMNIFHPYCPAPYCSADASLNGFSAEANSDNTYCTSFLKLNWGVNLSVGLLYLEICIKREIEGGNTNS